MSFSIIVAVAQNGVIGKDNKLPWYISEDLEYFYQVVDGKTVVMGHKTYASIGGPIKNSKNIVFSRDHSLVLPGATVLHSISELLDLYKDSDQEIMIVGGADLYAQLLPFVNKIYLTSIHKDVVGDTYFPDWQREQWRLVSSKDSESEGYSYTFEVFERNVVE